MVPSPADVPLSRSGERPKLKGHSEKGCAVAAVDDNRSIGRVGDDAYAFDYAAAVADVELRRAAVRAATALGAALGPGSHVSAAGTVYVVAETGHRMRVLREYVPVVGPLLAPDQPSLEECWSLLSELTGSVR